MSTSQPAPFVSTSSTPTAVPAQPTAQSVWEIDPGHALAQFKVRHLMVAHVRGQLGTVTGTLWLDERQPERSRVEVSIDARGIDTRNEARDQHLRSADFLDVTNHPHVTFRSTRVQALPDAALEVTGELTIRGVTQPVVLKVEPIEPAVVDPWGATKRGIQARASIKRSDFGLTWNAALEAGGVAVGDRVDIEIEIELARQAA